MYNDEVINFILGKTGGTGRNKEDVLHGRSNGIKLQWGYAVGYVRRRKRRAARDLRRFLSGLNRCWFILLLFAPVLSCDFDVLIHSGHHPHWWGKTLRPPHATDPQIVESEPVLNLVPVFHWHGIFGIFTIPRRDDMNDPEIAFFAGFIFRIREESPFMALGATVVHKLALIVAVCLAFGQYLWSEPAVGNNAHLRRGEIESKDVWDGDGASGFRRHGG
ncbi:hypothetical protein C8J57DRAFT_1297811 [Mycena rebaudengoi]|nr:hypothetical protein C8J57DRAFT_1297811 [Mycena rebaudengoi]